MSNSSQQSVRDEATSWEPSAKAASQFPEAESVSLSIEYYTDPLCCWSWAFEPQWRRLR